MVSFFREQFTKKIQEQENLGKVRKTTVIWLNPDRYTIQAFTLSFTFLFLQSLRDKQKALRESQAPNMKQMKMWSVSKNPVKILLQQ